MRRIPPLAVVLLAWFLVLGASNSRAADHSNLEEGLPTRVEDAYPIEYRGAEFQPSVRYELEQDGTDRFFFEPEFTVGAVRNGQISVSAEFEAGPGEREGSGDVTVGGLYNFNVESWRWPAFSILAGAVVPSGQDSRGTNLRLLGILTKGFDSHRFHLNGGYTLVGRARPNERNERFIFGIGYDYPLTLDIRLVAAYSIEEAEREGNEPIQLLEAGARTQVNPRTVLTLGVGTGLGPSPETPDFTAMVGMQVSF